MCTTLSETLPKILHIICSRGRGGVETFCPELIIGLHQCGFPQKVVVRKGASLQSVLASAGVATTVLPCLGTWDLFSRFCLSRIIQKEHPSIVQTWVVRASGLCPNLAGLHDPVRVAWYGGYYPAKHFRKTQHAIGITPRLCHYIKESLMLPEERIHYLPIMADLPSPLPLPLPRTAFATPQGVPLLLCLSRLSEEKGVDVLLRALVFLPECVVWIAGTGSQEKALKKLAQELQIQERVRWLGWYSDRAALLKAADVLVFPSRTDSFGAVMIEAWQTQTPLVACAAPGPCELIQPGEDGLLVPVGDSERLARAIREVLHKPALQAHLRKNGYRRYEAQFSKERILGHYRNFYKNLQEWKANRALNQSFPIPL